MNHSNLKIRNMRREELDILVDWAANEGWNPGLSDADIFWATDPEGFIAAELDGEMIGGGSIVDYDGTYGFMGFFIIHPDHRGRGLGNKLWHTRRQMLIDRLQENATIGMDGVFDMQAYYARGGFEFAGRDLRFQTSGQSFSIPDGIVNLGEIAFTDIEAYDRAHFPAPRSEFLRRWLNQPGAFTLGALNGTSLTGFAVMRPCRKGYKIGPLFADNPILAENLFLALSAQTPDETIYLDVPENNLSAMAMAKRYNMTEVFGCAKMYFGPKPNLPEHQIFGVTSFELG
jgi:GNAT superfamily N-acetyltransferase